MTYTCTTEKDMNRWLYNHTHRTCTISTIFSNVPSLSLLYIHIYIYIYTYIFIYIHIYIHIFIYIQGYLYTCLCVCTYFGRCIIFYGRFCPVIIVLRCQTPGFFEPTHYAPRSVAGSNPRGFGGSWCETWRFVGGSLRVCASTFPNEELRSYTQRFQTTWWIILNYPSKDSGNGYFLIAGLFGQLCHPRKRVLQKVPEQYRADREVMLAAAASDASCISLADKTLRERLVSYTWHQCWCLVSGLVFLVGFRMEVRENMCELISRHLATFRCNFGIFGAVVGLAVTLAALQIGMSAAHWPKSLI